MREIKFRAFDGERMRYDVTGFEHGQDNEMTAVFIDGDFYLINGCDHSPTSLVGNRTADVTQYTGLKDKNGKEIYEGDRLNICFTSDSGEFIHDGIYEASISNLEGLVFRFIELLWVSFGYNQYPINSELKRSNKLWSIYADNREYLCVQDKYKRSIDERCRFPFNEESELSFHSRYIEIIGNIYENPELLEK